jgi:hypothetical protein
MIAITAMRTASFVRAKPILALLLAAVMIGAVLAGLFARSHDLALRPLAVDEYYTVRSVEFVLEHGVPEFPSGGLYTRGLPLQYLLAASTEIFGQNAFAYRLPGLAFSLISVALAYWYARRFTGVPVAAAVAIALLVSSWHIEFAYFVRMYTLLQCLTLLFLIAVDDAYFGTGWRRRYVPHVLLVVAGSLHQLGLLLAPLLFLPLIVKDSGFWTTAQRLRFTAVGVLTALVCPIFERSVSALSRVADRYPSDYQAVHASSLRAPAFPYWRLDGDPWTTLLVVLGLIAVVLAALWLLKRKGLPVAPVDLWLCLLVILSAAHLLLLAGIVFLVLLLRHDLYRADRYPKRVYLLLAVAGVFAATWIVLTLTSPAILQSPDIGRRWDLAEASWVKAIWTTLFGWPDLYAWTVRPFAVELPVLGLLTAGALIYTVFVHRHEPLPTLLRQPWLVIAMTVLEYGLFQAPYSSSRYWYHLYPVILCLIALSVADVCTRLTRLARPPSGRNASYLGAFAFLGLFSLTSDFNPRHIAQMGTDAVMFRTGVFAPFWPTWYQRLDYEGPARFVNGNAAPVDTTRIIVEYHYPTSYYLQREHAIWLPRNTEVFDLHSRVRGTVDLWSNRRLLSTEQDIAEYTRTASDVWLIRSIDSPFPWEVPDPHRIWGDRVVEQSRAFASRDGRIEVVHLRLTPPSDQGTPSDPAAPGTPAAGNPQDAAKP